MLAPMVAGVESSSPWGPQAAQASDRIARRRQAMVATIPAPAARPRANPWGSIDGVVGRGGVERLDAGGVLAGDRLALELHGRGQLVAARQPLVGEQHPPLD